MDRRGFFYLSTVIYFFFPCGVLISAVFAIYLYFVIDSLVRRVRREGEEGESFLSTPSRNPTALSIPYKSVQQRKQNDAN